MIPNSSASRNWKPKSRSLTDRRALAFGQFDGSAFFGDLTKPAPCFVRPPVADFHAPPITEARLCIAQPPHLAQFGHLNVFRIEKTDLDILPSRSALPAGRHRRRRLGCRFVRNNW